MFKEFSKKFDFWLANTLLKATTHTKQSMLKKGIGELFSDNSSQLWEAVHSCLKDLGYFELFCEDGKTRQVRTLGTISSNSMLSYSSKENDIQTLESYRLDKVLKIKPITN